MAALPQPAAVPTMKNVGCSSNAFLNDAASPNRRQHVKSRRLITSIPIAKIHLGEGVAFLPSDLLLEARRPEEARTPPPMTSCPPIHAGPWTFDFVIRSSGFCRHLLAAADSEEGGSFAFVIPKRWSPGRRDERA